MRVSEMCLSMFHSALTECFLCILTRDVKVKCTLVQVLRLCTGRTAHRGSRGIALLFHDHGTRRGEGSALRPGRSLPPGKTWYPLYRRLGGPQGRPRQVRKISPPPGFEPRTVQPVASRYTDYATRPTTRDVRSVNIDITETEIYRLFSRSDRQLFLRPQLVVTDTTVCLIYTVQSRAVSWINVGLHVKSSARKVRFQPQPKFIGTF